MATPTLQFLPADVARDTLEGLATEHGPRRPWIYWWILAGIAAALGSLPLIEVDVSVRAAGVVRPTTGRADVRSAVSGHIAEVLARDNDRVVAGQALLQLTSRDVDVQLARNLARQSEVDDLIGDLKLLTADSIDRAVAEQPRPDPVPIKAVAGFKTSTLQREHAQLLAQLGSNELEETKARTEFDRYSTLAAKGVASRRDLDRCRYEVARLQAEAVLITRQASARWQARLRDEEMKLSDLRSDESRLREEFSHFTIRAPVEGLLIGFTGWSAGGFVSSGQVLGAVSPSDTLLVESFVLPRDIGLIATGQSARIEVDAFPHTQWGVLDGTVLSVSGDSLGSSVMESASMPCFKVVVQPAASELRLPSGLRAPLKKGLTVQTRFLVARRSVFQLLYDGTNSWINPQESAGAPAGNRRL